MLLHKQNTNKRIVAVIYAMACHLLDENDKSVSSFFLLLLVSCCFHNSKPHTLFNLNM